MPAWGGASEGAPVGAPSGLWEIATDESEQTSGQKTSGGDRTAATRVGRVNPYLALAAAGFRQQARERLVLVSGLLTALFFGTLRSAVFFALFGLGGHAAGLGLAQAFTYAWVVEAVFPVAYTLWGWNLAARIRAGDLVVDLIRPQDAFTGLLAYDVGRNLAQLVFRSTPMMLLAIALVPVVAGRGLALPGDPAGWAMALASMLLVPVIAFGLRFLQEAVAFVSADYRGLGRLLFFPLMLLAGFLIPIQFFPGPLRVVAAASPLFALLSAPARVWQGISPGWTLLAQLGWVVVLWLVCRWVFAVAVRRMVVHGG
jgi:ABC-2 type transport system permease protein